MSRSSRRSRRTLTALVATVTVGASLSFGAAAHADGNIGGVPYDVMVADGSGTKQVTTAEGADVRYVGDSSAYQALGSSGSGVFEPFVRLGKDGTEAGYNTGGTKEFDTKAGSWTHPVKISDIPVVQLGGQRYWELWADINETNSTSRIDLTDLEVWFAANPDLTGYPFNTNASNAATKVYDFSGDIQINDVNSGSGRADLRYLVPTGNIAIPASCNYGNPACTTQFVLYSKWGNADPTFASDGGFEEWDTKVYPFVSVTKTATTSYTRTFGWDITKSADPTSLDLNDGESGSTDWTVGVTKDEGTDSDWKVSGTITVENTSNLTAVVTGVTDTLSASGAVTPDCGSVTFPKTLAPDESFECTYSKTLTSGADQTNTATATISSGVTALGDVAYDGMAPVHFGAPTKLVNDTIHVTDTNGEAWTADSSDSWTYPESFTCGEDAGEHENTATITETGQSADATVVVTCHHTPSGTKTATPTHVEKVTWDISKVIDDGTPGGTHSVDKDITEPDTETYHVVATKTVSEEAFGLEGSLTVSNPNPDAVDVTLADTGLTPAVAGSSCTLEDTTVTVPGGTQVQPGTIEVDYSCSFPTAQPVVGTTYQNHATITDPHLQQPIGVTSGDIVFPAATLLPGSDPQTVTVTDDNAPDGAGFPATISETTTFPAYQVEYPVPNGCVDHPNTAAITAAGVEDSTNVHLCGPANAPTGVKTAEPTHSETVTWTVVKTVDDAADPEDDPTHALDLGTVTDAQTVDYHVTATKEISNETFGLAGTVTLSNTNPYDLSISGLTDEGLGIAGSSCTLDPHTDVIPKAVGQTPGTLSVGYSCTFGGDQPDVGQQYTNTVTFSYDDPNFDTDPVTVTAPVTFDEATLQDGSDPKTITVVDANAPESAGFPKTISTTTTFDYSDTYQVPNPCADHANTAELVAHFGGEGEYALTHEGATDSTNVHLCGPADAPTATKTAEPSHSELVTWTIDKTVEQNGGEQVHDLDLGTVDGAQTVNYHITATKEVSNEVFGLQGTVTLSNTNPYPIDVSELTDTGLTPALAGSQCTLEADEGTIPKAVGETVGTLSVPYACTFEGAKPDLGTTYTNHVTFTYADPNLDLTPTIEVVKGGIEFPEASLQEGSDQQTVTVDDPKAPESAGFPQEISETTVFPSFPMTYADHGTVNEDNTALFTQGATGSSTATVTYTIPEKAPIEVPKVTCTTGASTSVSLPVSPDGSTGAKTVQHVVQLSGLPAGTTTTVTAVLYGPSATAAVRGDTVVATQTFQAGNGQTSTSPVSVGEPGYYTWVVSFRDTSDAAPTDKVCGNVQAFLVHRADYAPLAIGTGFSGPVPGGTDRAAVTTLRIKALGIKARVATATEKGGRMQVPAPGLVGWLNRSAAVDDLIGTTVIAGHVSDRHDKPGALYKLQKARKGQIVKINGPHGVMKFKIVSVKAYARSKPLPSGIFTTKGEHRLALVTCTAKVVSGGRFHYTKNLVVIARPIG